MKYPRAITLCFFSLCFFLFSFSLPLAGAEPIVLEDLNKPQFIAVDQNQLYISENATVYIYSLKDFSLVATFGKEGEGPREFKLRKPVTIPLVLDVQTDDLVITCMGKVSFFDKKGAFKKEIRMRTPYVNPTIQPLGNGFVRTKYSREKNARVVSVLMCDKEMKPVTEYYRMSHVFKKGEKYNPLKRPLFITTDYKAGHLLVDTGTGPLHVFDATGKKKFTINAPSGDLTVTGQHKKAIYDVYRTDPRARRAWNYFKKMIEIPEKFPPVYVTLPSNGNIYVFTYRRKQDKTQCLVYDGSGKLIKDTFVPMEHVSLIEPLPLFVRDNKLYQMVENFDYEEWELHINEI